MSPSISFTLLGIRLHRLTAHHQRRCLSTMAWRCSGSSNDELVGNLYKAGIIKSTRIRDAMKATDRKVCPSYPAYGVYTLAG